MSETRHTAPALPRLLAALQLLLPLLLIAGLLALAVYLWRFGGMAALTTWAAGGQREAQNAMAGTLRALRGGEPGALIALLGICFAYGLFHAAGPGHGKLLIGGYGVSQKVTALRLSGLALISSLAQSASAVLLVTAGIALLDWSRERMVGLAEDWLAPASYAAIGLVGAWLALRGLRHLWQGLRSHRQADSAGQDHEHGHAHGPDHQHHHHHADGSCSCGHRHGPTAEEAARVRSLREAVLLVGAIAIRPCTGALFLLILTRRMDILAAGIAGTFAMGLGVASVTIGVALATVFLRAGTFDRSTETGSWDKGPSPLLAMVELLAGALIASAATGLFLHMI
ncbi:nickel/cobalt transporter [Oceanicola sp. S124]|uniref:nickel/cobalt transporter n=1 Tax=Oceanicola sp. S124 TaxID=1042378 RepID=UPI0002558563|nr:membrane protein [Oceanicola sp. S124]